MRSSGEDIGDLPDLSVAETLERVVGVTSDRFKGGASELSIRGLGAFLGASYLNGREISSGSDGRDVNFGQFPSELINGVIVYKSQQAKFHRRRRFRDHRTADPSSARLWQKPAAGAGSGSVTAITRTGWMTATRSTNV